jgi:hypothetical protein
LVVDPVGSVRLAVVTGWIIVGALVIGLWGLGAWIQHRGRMKYRRQIADGSRAPANARELRARRTVGIVGLSLVVVAVAIRVAIALFT